MPSHTTVTRPIAATPATAVKPVLGRLTTRLERANSTPASSKPTASRYNVGSRAVRPNPSARPSGEANPAANQTRLTTAAPSKTTRQPQASTRVPRPRSVTPRRAVHPAKTVAGRPSGLGPVGDPRRSPGGSKGRRRPRSRATRAPRPDTWRRPGDRTLRRPAPARSGARQGSAGQGRGPAPRRPRRAP